MNLPNKLTVARLLLTVVFVVITASPLPWAFSIGLWIFAIASITDWLDGKIARERGLVTAFGKLMDPLADKVLMAAAFVTLQEKDLMPGWLVIAILAREFLVTGLRLVATSQGSVLAADKLGKQKTVWQIVTACYLLVYQASLEAPLTWAHGLFTLPGISWSVPHTGYGLLHALLLAVTLITTLWSGWAYFWKNRQIVLREM